MIWALQDSVNFNALECNVKPLFAALKELDKQVIFVGVTTEDSPKITGLDSLNIRRPTMFYGSTLLAALAADSDFTPGSYYCSSWWNPANWLWKRDDLLNNVVEITPFGTLRDKWISQPTFIKPVDPKKFNGQVIEGREKDEWLSEYQFDDHMLVACSPVQDIEREWRFFIVGGKVITGSLYKRYGCLVIREPISPDVYAAAEMMAKKWMPSDTLTMDICELKNGEFKVVEWNCINSSGFYNADIKKIIIALEEYAE